MGGDHKAITLEEIKNEAVDLVRYSISFILLISISLLFFCDLCFVAEKINENIGRTNLAGLFSLCLHVVFLLAEMVCTLFAIFCAVMCFL